MARRRKRPAPARSGWDGWDPYDFPSYVSRAERRAEAERTLQRLRERGQVVSPVEITGRTIATTFWGTAWCENLEGYSDFANRLPRGRTYVRNGSVIDLQIEAGRVTALVSGTDVYRVVVKVSRVPRGRWRDICARCAGEINSLVELLQGRFSDAVMAHLCRQDTGLFPAPREITFDCSCPDVASMCKHVAAVLYGVGARLDRQPELLFRLREVDERDLVAHAASDVPLAEGKMPASSRVLADHDLGALFGLELGTLPQGPGRANPEARPAAERTPGSPRRSPAAKPASRPSRTKGRKARK